VKIFNTRLKKIGVITGAILVALFVTVILCISPIAKYLIEKYAVKYTGRRITIDYAYVNPFTGYVYLKNLQIQENESDSVFLSAKGVSAKFSMLKFFNRTCEITELRLDKLNGIIIETPDGINFRDLIKRFSPKDTIKSKNSFHVNVLNMQIDDGILRYRETSIPINYSAIHLNIESPGLRWNTDTLAAKVSLESGNGGGTIKGNITINLRNVDYKLNAIIDKIQLKFLEQYFKMISNYGSFRATLDANIKANGSFRDAEKLNASGAVFINDFHFGETPGKDFVSFEKFALKINALDPKNKQYILDSASLIHPYFKFERYDYLDNFEMMFGKKGTLVSSAKNNSEKFNLIIVLGNYIKTLARNFFRSDYKVNRVAIVGGDFKYGDYSLNEKFLVDAAPVNITADSIAKSKTRVKFFLKSGIKPYGDASVYLSINPKDSSDFDLSYNIQKLPVALFNPYLISYTSFPLDRGTVQLSGSWKVRDGIIHSNNHILVIDPRSGKRIRNKNLKWKPVPLLMFFVRDDGDVIDYQVPIDGNLKNPNFHLRNVILSILKNIVVKPVTTVYRREVRTAEDEIENSIILKWQMRQSSLLPGQVKFLKKIASLIKDSSSLSISIQPLPYADKEKEYILFFEAKKKYFLSMHHQTPEAFTKSDSTEIDRMSNKDSSFISYLNKMAGKQLLYTVQDKCTYMLGQSFINGKYKQLNERREKVFISYFNEKLVANRVKILPQKDNIPYNGYSYYRISYRGTMPSSLIKAYKQMSELNNEVPRNKYYEVRKRIGQPF